MRKRYDRTLQEGYASDGAYKFLRCTVFSGYFDYRCAGDGRCHVAVGFVRPGSQNVFRHVSRYGGCGNFLYFENLFPNRKHWHGNQTIQEALAGAKRVGEFLELPTRLETSGEAGEKRW